MKKNLDKSIELISKSGSHIFSSIEEAMEFTGLTKRQLEIRATKESVIKGIKFKWKDPSTRKSYLGKKSRRKGNNWELEIINKLKEIGYTGCVSSRSESKRVDDAKIDIIDLNNQLPCYIQAKATQNLPNYHKIHNQCSFKDKPFVIACKQENKTPLVIVPIDFFYELLKHRLC